MKRVEARRVRQRVIAPAAKHRLRREVVALIALAAVPTVYLAFPAGRIVNIVMYGMP